MEKKMDNRNYRKLYQDAMSALQADQRPQLDLTENERKQLILIFRQHLTLPFSPSSEEILGQLLCIMTNCKRPIHQFAAPLMEALDVLQQPDLVIYTLGATELHILQHYFASGDPLPPLFMKKLRKLLGHPQLEVLSWVLRIVEQLGPKGIILRSDILKHRPKLMQLFNPHYRIVKKMIAALEMRWKNIC